MFDEFGINAGFVEDLYYRFLENPHLVHESWRVFFSQKAIAVPLAPAFSPLVVAARLPDVVPSSGVMTTMPPPSQPPASSSQPAAVISTAVFAQAQVTNLVNAYRTRGHIYADINPLQEPQRGKDELELAKFGLSSNDFDAAFSAAGMAGRTALTLREILGILEETYCRSIGVEFMQIDEPEIRAWLQSEMEVSHNRLDLTREEQLRVLTKLTDAEVLEQFIDKAYKGAKRFSLEGAESLIPLLDLLVEGAGAHGVEEVVFGMAHRGRLNVLCNILNKNVRELFAAFADNHPEWHFGSGDVKYHLGYSTDRVTTSGNHVHLTLAFNPSHLEWVNPVVEGRARAKQDRRGDREGRRVMPLLIHGDAAFMGQGVVAETLNMAGLSGYRTGGTVHVIVNNQVGFTTDPSDARSTRYASDIARMLKIPVFHVNGEDPEAVAQVASLAIKFRQKFGKDVIIDMYCYRKWGHNENDEPRFTQPIMYAAIDRQPSVREMYVKRLLEKGQITAQQAQEIAEGRRQHLMHALEETKQTDFSKLPDAMGGVWKGYIGGPDAAVAEVSTAVDATQLLALLKKACSLPEGFEAHKTVARVLRERVEKAERGQGIDWGTGEALAFASLLSEGVPIRISGQDARRGTFSHRHAVVRDTRTGVMHAPLSKTAAAGARFEVFDSPLSESGVLGFDYGYSIDTPEGLVCWEAQFGDFVNSAQVIIDQFLCAAEDKWHRLSGLVMLLPHGFEGQGPEHSSARLERFLNLSSEDNIQVCNLTTPAQLFHALRRQVHRPIRKPLVILTPKSYLRHPDATSTLQEVAQGSFQRVIPDSNGVNAANIKRILLCSGKVYFELAATRKELAADDVAILRLEQLYPLNQELTRALAVYPEGTPVVWVQEEPWNMGAWFYINARLPAFLHHRYPVTCISRQESASPATGSQAAHKVEQRILLDAAFAKNKQSKAAE